MKKMRILLAAVVMSALVGGYLLGAHAGPSKAALSKDVKCPITGKPVKADQFVEFNGGKVYFCCGGCAGEFEKDPDTFAAKANLQLVQTGQLKQVACPFSGKPTSPTTALDVAGVNVTFCCDHCKAKAAETASDDQVNLIFADASKGFKTVK